MDTSNTFSQADLEAIRGWNGVLSLWRLCGKPACRRARACRGAPLSCFRREFPLMPEGVRAWFAGVGQAQTNKLDADTAMEWLYSTPAGEAMTQWTEAVKASMR